jgi:hypothetical protein
MIIAAAYSFSLQISHVRLLVGLALAVLMAAIIFALTNRDK